MSWKFDLIQAASGKPIAGLAWDGAAMLFSDTHSDTIQRYDPRDGKISTAVKYTNRTFGIALGPEGALYVCQEGGRRVVRMMPDGTASVTITRLEGRVHNHPRFITVDRHGNAWFSDRYHSNPAPHLELHGQLDHQSVLRIGIDNNPRPHWRIDRMTFDTHAPTGVAVAPDGSTLYVAESENSRDGIRELRAYPIAREDSLGPPVVLHTFGADRRGIHRGIEGMCVDTAGSIMACAGSVENGPGPLIYVFSPKGAIQATYEVPQGRPLNCAFGDPGLNSLYVSTVEGHLYRVATTGHTGYLPFTRGS